MAKGPRLDLTAHPLATIKPARECKERSCIHIADGANLTVPTHSFGQYDSMTFSFWYKPAAESNANARIFFLSATATQNGMFAGRNGGNTILQVTRDGEIASYEFEDDAWSTGSWKHIAWSLALTNSNKASWSVYVNGVKHGDKADGLDLANTNMNRNFIGSTHVAGNQYVGFLDSFLVFSEVLSASEVEYLFKVRHALECSRVSSEACAPLRACLLTYKGMHADRQLDSQAARTAARVAETRAHYRTEALELTSAEPTRAHM
jgi:hypothetical protein